MTVHSNAAGSNTKASGTIKGERFHAGDRRRIIASLIFFLDAPKTRSLAFDSHKTGAYMSMFSKPSNGCDRAAIFLIVTLLLYEYLHRSLMWI